MRVKCPHFREIIPARSGQNIHECSRTGRLCECLGDLTDCMAFPEQRAEAVKRFNAWQKEIDRAYSFVSCIDHALKKSDENAKMQMKIIGWNPMTETTLIEALRALKERGLDS